MGATTRKKYQSKFNRKKHSRKGVIAAALGAASALIGIFSEFYAFHAKGEGSVYLGSIGLLAFMLAILAVIFAVQGMKEEKSFHKLPVLGFVLGSLSLVAWLGLYIIGFLVA